MFIRPNTLKGMFRFLEVINRMLRNQTVKRYRINTVWYRDPNHYRQGLCYVVWAPQFFLVGILGQSWKYHWLLNLFCLFGFLVWLSGAEARLLGLQIWKAASMIFLCTHLWTLNLRRSQVPPKFLSYLVILCFEKRRPKIVVRLKSHILSPHQNI